LPFYCIPILPRNKPARTCVISCTCCARHCTLRSLLVHRYEDIPLFDEAFEAFWRKPADGWTMLDLRAMSERRRSRRPLFTSPSLRQPPATASDSQHSPSSADELPVVEVTRTYSAREVLRHKDFAELSSEELEAIKQLMAMLVWQLGERRTRRKQPGHGQLLDL
jgi:uncharacterized protein with von Willebrand factor type A (vWA) domain